MEQQPTDNSPNQVSELVERLRPIEDDLPDDLHQQILTAGPAIVPALIDLVTANLQDPEKDSNAAIHAAELLGELGDERAIPVLLDCLVECDPLDWLYETAVTALTELGDKALEPCLLHYASIQDDRRRNFVAEILSNLGVTDDRIFTILVETLHRLPDLGAMYLANYGDSRAVPLLLAKFDELPLDEDEDSLLLANHAFIELKAAIELLGGSLNADQQEKYQTGLALRERLVEKLFPWAKPFESTPPGETLEAALPGTYQPIKGAKKLGRNEPCWCGSGKKYKKCHLPLE
ncbi:MAG: SEC-C metal-binding domain-containing protein [Candidatus Competibacteraceae bacterium]